MVVCKFEKIRRVDKVKSYLPIKEFEKVINLLIMLILDYCNSLHYGIVYHYRSANCVLGFKSLLKTHFLNLAFKCF